MNPPVQRADLLVGQRGEVNLHQVGDQPDAHVLVDPRAGVLDQEPAEDAHRLADQVGHADQGERAEAQPQQGSLVEVLLGPFCEVVEQTRRGSAEWR